MINDYKIKNAIYDAVLQEVVVNQTLLDSTNFAYPNAKFESNGKSEWVKFSWLPVNEDINQNAGQTVFVGIMQVDVIIESGTSDAEILAEPIVLAVKKSMKPFVPISADTVSRILIESTTVSQPFQDKNLWRTPITVNIKAFS